MSVHRMLVTGSADDRRRFWLALMSVANFFDVRGETLHFAIMGEDRQRAVEAARRLGLTLQEIVGAGDNETYRIIVGEEGTGWKPPARRKRKSAK